MTPRPLAVTVALACLASTAVRADDAADLLQPTPVTDAKTGIQLRVPLSWKVKGGIKDTGYEAPAKDRNAIGGLAPSIILAVIRKPGIKPEMADAVVRNNRAQYAKLFKGYKDLPAAGAVPACPGKGIGVVECTFLVDGVLPVHERQVWVLGDGVAYYLTLMSLADTFDANSARFDAALRSVAVP